MVRRDLVAAKLADLSDRVSRVQKHCANGADQLESDRDALDLVAFNLMLAVQICADIASHIISDEGWPAANSLSDGFVRLGEYGVVERSTAETLAKAVGLRNIVAHGYSGIDVQVVFDSATRGLDDLRSFARQVGMWLSAQEAQDKKG